MISTLTLALAFAGMVQGQAIINADNLAPFIPSPQVVVDRMLEASHLQPGEVLYDLGAGDGRVVITAAQKFGAKAVGVELSKDLCIRARVQIAALGLAEQVSILHADLSGYVMTDLTDGSCTGQVGASYDLTDFWSLGAYLSATTGGRRTEWGSLRSSTSAIVQLVRYL